MVKMFATILFAICVFSQLALSAEWDDLTEDIIGKVSTNLIIRDKLRFASTSRGAKEAVDAYMSPKDVLTGTVNSVIHDSAGSKSRAFYVMPFKLEAMTVPNVPVDDFVMVKGPNYQYARDDREHFLAKLDEMKGTVLTKAESNSREKILLDGEDRMISGPVRMNVYANFHKYSPSEITECMNNAYTRIRSECIDGAMVRQNHSVRKLLPSHESDVVMKYNTLYMVKSCSSYSFMCGIAYHM